MFCDVDLLVLTHISFFFKKKFFIFGKMQINRGGGDLITSKESKMTCNNGGETIKSLIEGLLLSHIWICFLQIV